MSRCGHAWSVRGSSHARTQPRANRPRLPEEGMRCVCPTALLRVPTARLTGRVRRPLHRRTTSARTHMHIRPPGGGHRTTPGGARHDGTRPVRSRNRCVTPPTARHAEGSRRSSLPPPPPAAARRRQDTHAASPVGLHDGNASRAPCQPREPALRAERRRERFGMGRASRRTPAVLPFDSVANAAAALLNPFSFMYASTSPARSDILEKYAFAGEYF